MLTSSWRFCDYVPGYLCQNKHLRSPEYSEMVSVSKARNTAVKCKIWGNILKLALCSNGEKQTILKAALYFSL